MYKYLGLVEKIFAHKYNKTDRTQVGTLSSFGQRLELDMQDGFPLLTTREIDYRSVINELLWMLSGSTNLYDLPEETRKWWRPWAKEDGSLGPIYGEQWRSSRWADNEGSVFTVDQLAILLNILKQDPDSRRAVVNLWHTPAMEYTQLPCCHGTVIQFYSYFSERGDSVRSLDCQVYQRSADVFLGLPVNLASYSLLLHMIAKEVGMVPRRLVWVGGDVHIYNNHIPQLKEQCTRQPLPLPSLSLAEGKSIIEYTREDISIVGYKYHPAIAGRIAV